MKRRRPNVRNQARSLRHSPRLGEARASDSVLLRSKSSQCLKYTKLPRNAKHKRQSQGHGDEISLRKNVFDSLETLFDVQKYPNFPEIESLRLPDDNTPESLSPKSSNVVENNLPIDFPHQIQFHTDTAFQNSDNVSSQTTSEYNSETTMEEINNTMAEEEKDLDDANNVTASIANVDQIETAITPEQSNSLQDIVPGEDKLAVENQEETGTDEPIPDSSVIKEEDEPEEAEREVKAEGVTSITDNNVEDEARPPEYPIPPGMAEGIAIQPGQRPDSLISSLAITDSEITREINEAKEKCRLLYEEISDLKQEVAELQQKNDLTDEDKRMVEHKSNIIMHKMAEMEEMTRKLEKLIGLSDTPSEEFSKAFDMYPGLPAHHRDQETGQESDAEKYPESCKEIIIKDDHSKITFGAVESLKPGETFDDDQFDLSPPKFPEDRLPRVIVCGYTEDNLPKIVVADSQRKPRADDLQQLKSITGKLTEALNMQEKLVQENSKIESSKYKLQEALLEKDNAVDLLQRKVCGLQREMQILMKENQELSRQLARINEQIGNHPANCPVQGNSPRSINKPGPFPDKSPRQQSCKCSPRGQPDIINGQSSCAGARSLNTTGKYSLTRLGGGGGSQENFDKQNIEMCCRNPSTTPRSAVGSPSTRGPCPAEIENKLDTYETSTRQLEQQLGCMESEVKNLRAELANVQRERQQLDQERKLLKCTAPCAPCPCPAPQDPGSLSRPYSPANNGSQIVAKMSPAVASSCSGICIDQPPGASNCPQQQLRDLREQYARLQEDYKNKLCEVSCLRTDAEKMKQESREAREAREKAENRMIDLQERLKKYESEKSRFGGSREQMIEDKHRLMVAEQRHREALEELEELRLSNQEYVLQLEDYRNKYLKAQEMVEEQTRQLDLMEMDNARMNENVTLEIGRVKNQFQEKLAELAPLPEILKQTQLKLQEALQMRAMAERNCEDIDRELLAAKDKIGALSSQLEIFRSENALLKGEKGSGSDRLDQLENQNSELRTENDRLRNAVARLEELEAEYEEKLEQKMHDIVQLSSENEQVRQDAARQVARTKERCENIRRTMQEQIADMEKQLAQCRAIAKAAQKDRDEIRQKMQGQINRLSESFEQAQGRIRTLQGHVNYLKTSYSNVFSPPGQAENPTVTLAAENMSSSPYDTCDCAL